MSSPITRKKINFTRASPENSSQLLMMKLVPSFISRPLLRRSRIFTKLTHNANAKLVLIQGTAGSGKSSLLYDYCRLQEVAIAWYSLQESDQDLKIFLSYLLTSISLHHPQVTKKILPNFDNINIVQSWKNVLTFLFNEIGVYKKQVWVVLDDYHFVDDNSLISEALEFILLNSPQNLRFFVASRIIPKLPLAYLQSKNSMTALRTQDLLLDHKELRQLFYDVWNQPISEKALEMIYTVTEGWVAAVTLIAQALRHKTAHEIEHYLRHLNLKDNYIYDYFAREVYHGQPLEVRNFLKATSILGSFNAELAESVGLLSNTKKIIQSLESMTLLTLHLDSTKEWYRYHHLFSSFLKNALYDENSTDEIRKLHQRAACWYEENRFWREAIVHNLEAKNYESAAKVLREKGELLFQQGALTTLLKCINAFPEKIIESSPSFLLLEGEIQDALGNWTRAIRCYEKALEYCKTHDLKSEIPSIIGKLILCLNKYGQNSKIFEYCREALKLYSESNQTNHGVRSRLLNWLGVAHVTCGDAEWQSSYELLKQAYLLAQQSGEPDAIASSCIGYGFACHFMQGNFFEAERVFNDGITILKRMEIPFLACHLTMNKGVVQIFSGMLEEASKTIVEAASTAQEYKLHFVEQALRLTQAMLYLEAKQVSDAKKALSGVASQEIPLQLTPWYYRSVAILHLLEGNIEQAHVAGEDMLDRLQLVGKGMYAPECYLTLGVVYWKNHLVHKARKYFGEALLAAERGNMKFWIMKSHFFLAALFATLGNAGFEFKKHYHMAIKLSRENNYWHFWATDLFNVTVPLVLEAFKADLELLETQKVMKRIKPALLRALELILEEGNSAERSLACEVLGVLRDADALVLLKKARKDPVSAVRNKARKVFLDSSPAPLILSVMTLGSFEVFRGKKEISHKEWHRKKAIQLFKYLLTVYPREAIVDQILETFWPSLPLKEAKHNFAVNLNYIRSALNPSGHRRDESFIVCGPDTVQLNLRTEDRIDFVEFNTLWQQGYEACKQDLTESNVLKVKEALSFYKGDFLEGDLYEEWTMSQREQLQKKYLLALECVGGYHEKHSEFQEAFQYYRLYLTKEPVHENVFKSALRCLAALGDKGGAKKEFVRFNISLRKQLGKTSSPKIKAYMDEILSS